jgi:hypothetical protein
MNWFFNRSLVIDLDNVSPSQGDLEVFPPSSGIKNSRATLVRVLSLMLREIFACNCVACNFFFDEEDDCLRALGYLADDSTPPEFTSLELYPAPGFIAISVLTELRRHIRLSKDAPPRIHCLLNGECRVAQVDDASETDIRLYFSDDRPCIKTKGVKYAKS